TNAAGWPIELFDVRGAHVEQNTITISGDDPTGGYLLFGRDLSTPGSASIRNNIFDYRGRALEHPICDATSDGSCSGGYAHAGLEIGNNLYFGSGSGAPIDHAASS